MFAVIFIPHFALQAVLRHEPELKALPVALLTDAKSPGVWQMTAAASAAGVAAGMVSTQAQARCPSIVFRARSDDQEKRAQEILIECGYAVAAQIESTDLGVCTLDLRGLPMNRSDEQWREWGNQIIDRIARFQLDAHVGMAATPGLALQAARVANPFLSIGNTRDFWQRLPIDNVSDSAQTLNILRRWGVTTVGEFLALGKDKIAERLGADGVELFERAQADALRPLRLTTPAQSYEETYDYEREVETIEPLLFMLRRFLEQLAQRVEVAGLVVEELTLSLRLASTENYVRAFRIPAPTRDIEVLFRILHNHLESLKTEAPVIALTLRAKPCASSNQQFELFESAVRDPNRFYEAIGRLSALLGTDRVGSPKPASTHRPDDFRMQPIGLQRRSPVAAAGGRMKDRRGLPLRRFRPPLKITVEVRNARPSAFQSARVSGVVAELKGPWRISGDWWEQSWSREEWDVQTKQGTLYRLFRDGQDWFVEGAYD